MFSGYSSFFQNSSAFFSMLAIIVILGIIGGLIYVVKFNPDIIHNIDFNLDNKITIAFALILGIIAIVAVVGIIILNSMCGVV